MGAKEGFVHLMWVLLEPGDAALVPRPSYPIHIHGPMLAGASVFQVPMGPDEDLFANLEEAWERARPRPRVIVLSFPHNPTTATVDLDFMERVVAFAREHEVVVVHDFAYADLAFDGYEPPSILQVPGADEVAVELYTLTKSFSMAGWRVGFLCGNARLVGALGAAQVVARLRHVPADPDRRDHRHERGAGHAARGRRGLPLATRRALRRPRPRRLGGPAAPGDDVRLGARPRAVRGAGLARVRRAARP